MLLWNLVSFLFVVTIWLLGSGKPIAASPSRFEDYPRPGADSKFAASLGSSEANQPEVFAQALSLLTSLESSPSCNRLATSTLIKSCQTLGGPSESAGQEQENPEALLDNVKSIYAARLAVCELVEAGTPAPAQCSPIMAKKPARKQYGFGNYLGRNGRPKNGGGGTGGYSSVSPERLGHCLKSLESRPQWWTSYSNGRQNAIVICQAVRIDIEKDDLLSLHKSMVGVTSDLSSALSGVLQESGTQLADHMAFAEAVQKFQSQVLSDLEGASSKAQGLFAKFKQDVDSMTQTVANQLRRVSRVAEADADALGQKIRESGNEAKVLRETLRETIQEVRNGDLELAAGRASNRELAQDVQNSLEQLRANQTQGLSETVQAVMQALDEWATLQIIKYEERMNKTFEVLLANAQALSALQAGHEESQSRQHKAHERHLEQASETLSQLVTAFGNLQSTIEKASTKSNVMGGVGWACLILVLVGGVVISKKIAGYMAIIAGTAIAFNSSGLLERLKWLTLSYPRSPSTDLELYLQDHRSWLNFGLLISGFCIAMGIALAAIKFMVGLQRRKVASDLPTTENRGDLPDVWQKFMTADKKMPTGRVIAVESISGPIAG
ncbi:MAG: hypothetical protein M1840_004436 [Geoglossum simile]|nr:MAG: hypothetical protein M1840_004436 [Geoglossum simile]